MNESGNPSPASSPPAVYQRWLAEMKRRRLPRVIAVYGATSFVVLEVADLVFPAIPLPDVALRLVLWALILGFPIAVALAWAFDVTPDGLVRTEAAAPGEIDAIVAAPVLTRWPSGLLALGGLALLAAAFYGGRRSAVDLSVDPSLDVPAVAEMALLDPVEDPAPLDRRPPHLRTRARRVTKATSVMPSRWSCRRCCPRSVISAWVRGRPHSRTEGEASTCGGWVRNWAWTFSWTEALERTGISCASLPNWWRSRTS